MYDTAMTRPLTKGPPRAARLPLSTDELLVAYAEAMQISLPDAVETILEAALWDEAFMGTIS